MRMFMNEGNTLCGQHATESQRETVGEDQVVFTVSHI